MRQPLEEVRLHFVERTLRIAEWHDEIIISRAVHRRADLGGSPETRTFPGGVLLTRYEARR
ncbi:hypothetical protein GCM10009819_08190 [Agromyces tropicus]|uniref:NUDIX hydrolase n=1 Tax=Agromyces tropicus TaxID=555371 RepID=A0ABN2U2B2_9MICO